MGRIINITTIRDSSAIGGSSLTEVVDSLAWSLSELGNAVGITSNWLANDPNILNIMFLTNSMPVDTVLPPNIIMYHVEQWLEKKAVELAGDCEVWDYSLENYGKWRSLGKKNVRYVPFGYTPILTRIPKKPQEGIDVLFYGHPTPRRRQLIEDLKKAGLKAWMSLGSGTCFGGARDSLISMSKIVLNVHQDPLLNTFEMARVSYLMANSKCVVSEVSADDCDYTELDGGLVRVPYEGIVAKCQQLLIDDDDRWTLEGNALEAIRKRDYTAQLRKVLSI